MILIIDSVKRKAETLADILYHMGIIARAVTPRESFAEISELYRAAIITSPDKLPDINDFIGILHSRKRSLPIFTLSDEPHEYDSLSTLKNYSTDISPADMINDIKKVIANAELPPICYYRIAGIDLACKPNQATMFGIPLSLTKTEGMIFKYMILSYPMPQDAKSILKYAFRPSRQPDIASIRTHISLMNRKFRMYIGRNLIISVPDRGYVISTPEVLESLA